MAHLVWVQAARNTVLISPTAPPSVAGLTVEPLGERGRGVATTYFGDTLNGTEKAWEEEAKHTQVRRDRVTFW